MAKKGDEAADLLLSLAHANPDALSEASDDAVSAKRLPSDGESPPSKVRKYRELKLSDAANRHSDDTEWDAHEALDQPDVKPTTVDNSEVVISKLAAAKSGRNSLPKTTTAILKEWFYAHQSHPYPSEKKKVNYPCYYCFLTVATARTCGRMRVDNDANQQLVY